jgi:hypothetical protein
VLRLTRTPRPCGKYDVRFEDYLGGNVDTELEKHLGECSHCRAALQDAQLANAWLREAWEPSTEPNPSFLAGVMSRIRDEKMKAESGLSFWSPLEFLASRLSLSAAVLLLALSGYLAISTKYKAPPPADRPELSATDFPQPPADPASQDEVLQSLAERTYGH